MSHRKKEPAEAGATTRMRVFNFSAGPAVLPLPVLEQARDELLDWRGGGMSVMEVSHRSKAFIAMAEQAEADLRELLAIPDSNYKVLFLQGGATRAVRGGAAEPVPRRSQRRLRRSPGTGRQKAMAEARRFVTINVAADTAASRHTTVPAQAELRLDPGAAYVHYTPNETIGGVEFPYIPDTGGVPLVADLSSTILSRPLDVTRFGLIYAGAQKNIGPSGLAVVIVREDLLGRARTDTPAILDYRAMAEEWLDAEHAADLRLVHRRAGFPLAEARGRPGRDGEQQPHARRASSTRRSTIPASTAIRSPASAARG